MSDTLNIIEDDKVKQKGTAYGAASLTRVLNGIGFPVTKEEIILRYGHKEVQYSKGNLRTLKEIIDKCSKQSFTSMSELIESCARRPYKNSDGNF
jgi:hypothetical protein